MLKKIILNAFSNNNVIISNINILRSSQIHTLPWEICISLCIERKPLITREYNELEKNYQNMQLQLEFENSILSDHELKLQQEKNQMIKDLKTSEAIDTSSLTASEKEVIWKQESNNFKPFSRITDDDINNNTKSLNRILDKHLVLVVKQKLGDKSHWILPLEKLLAQENCRQGAERMLNGLLGSKLIVRILGNAPWSFHKYKYPPNQKYIGAKVFLMKASYMHGDIVPNETDILEYAWVNRKKLKEILRPSYYHTIKKVLIDEE